MLKNYITIAYRNLMRNRIFALLNILGLAIGIACAIVIYMYVRQETSYDTFYQKADRTYRLTMDFKLEENLDSNARSSLPIFEKMVREMPEVETATKIREFNQAFIEYENVKLEEKHLWYADEHFFQVFDQRFLYGTATTALSKPNTIVLTESLAQKVFGRTNVVGKTFKIDENKTYEVSGVIADVPYNTHFRFNGLVSMVSLYKTDLYKRWQKCPDCLRIYGYVALKSNTNFSTTQAKIKNLFKKETSKGYLKKVALQPMLGIHLTSKLNGEIQANGNIQFVYTFGAVALLILIIAAINYMNLATAKSMNRAKEVGIRKVMGSYRSQLIAQFLTESLIVVYISLIGGALLVDLLVPLVSQIAPKPLSFKVFDQQFFILLFLGGTFLGIISGLYPAFALSGFKPVKVLKGKFAHQKNAANVRKGLVIVQFTISSILIVSTIIAYQQLRFMQDQSLGFKKDNLLVVSLSTDRMQQKAKVFKQELLNNSQIKSVALTSNVPGSWTPSRNYTRFVNQQTKDTTTIIVPTHGIDYEFVNTMGLKLKQGRNFSLKRPTDSTKAVLINEAMAKKLGWENPVGHQVANFAIKGQIVGVVSDYHFRSLHDKIEPTVYQLMPRKEYYQFALVKVQGKDLSSTLNFIENTWKKFEGNRLYNSFFLDQNFAKQYQADQQREVLFIAFAGLAIVIACLGLFGLAAYTVERRIKEIGIRKVLGASVASIFKLISYNFIVLILLANVVAIPLSYWLMTSWLKDFAYHINISWWVFGISVVLVGLTALLTISYQTIKASLANPVEAIRYE
ncbi:hypothetical protein BKI52_12790 [marine bacterium AO1-C]|nr:hypothetical protein BKI52_12790 [marine bacterium AO1-C]